MIRSTGRRAAFVAVLLVGVGCADADSAPSDGSPADADPSTAVTAPTTAAQTTAASVATVPTSSVSVPIEFPPSGLPVDADSEWLAGDVASLRNGGQWIFGMLPPSTLVRIDPVAGEVVELDVGLDESRAGPAQHVASGELVWVLGGPFRDTLVAVDPASMTEVRRVQLAEDHSLASSTAMDELWLLSLRSALPVDSEGTPGDPVELEVDPVSVAADADAAWVALPAAAQVARVDTATGKVTAIDTEPGPGQLVLDGTTLWVAHSPTGTVSRIDTTTEQVASVTDVDIAGDAAAATMVTGLRPAPQGVWAIVRYDGSPYRPVLVLLDRASGDVVGARTVNLDIDTQTDHDGNLWIHRADSGTLIRLDSDAFLDEQATPLADLAPPTTIGQAEPTTTIADESSADADADADADAVAEAFAAFIDPTVDAATLDLGPLASVRDDLIQLLTAQVQGEVSVADVTFSDERGIVHFDVLIEGETVVLPNVELAFDRTPSGAWTTNAESLCSLATGVGLTCRSTE